MKRGTIFLILFILIAGAVIAASQFLRGQPPVEITVAVDPLAESWVRQAVNDFNASEPRINGTRRVHVNLTVISDLDVWRGGRGASAWTEQNHPDVWIPAASFSVTYGAGIALPLETVVGSLARTPLVWGGYASRVDVLTEDGSVALDWEQVRFAAEAETWAALGGEASWRFVNLAFALPDRTIGGLAVLFSGAATFGQTTDLSAGVTRRGDFRDWLQPVINSVPNFNTVGSDVAAFLARGTASADIAIGPESQWLVNLEGILRNEDVRFSYPAYTFVFDFPLARWQDSTTGADTRAAVEAFADWLTAPAQQEAAKHYGLRPASAAPTASDPLFARAEAHGIRLDPVFPAPLLPPSLTETQSLLQWFSTAHP